MTIADMMAMEQEHRKMARECDSRCEYRDGSWHAQQADVWAAEIREVQAALDAEIREAQAALKAK